MTGINNKFPRISNDYLNLRGLTTAVATSLITATSFVLLKKVYDFVVKFFNQFHHKVHYGTASINASIIVPLRGDEDDESFKIEERGISDRKSRDNQMKERNTAKSIVYKLNEFKEKWDGKLSLKSLDMAWNFEGYNRAELKSQWNMLRLWLRSQDDAILVKDWSAEIKNDFLKDVQKDEDEFSSLFDFMTKNINLATEGEKKVVELMDANEILCSNRSLQESPFVAFGQTPKYHTRYLGGIYNHAERIQIFPIIQSLFQENDILTCGEVEFNKKVDVFNGEVSNLINKSILEASSLKKDIKKFIFFEYEFDKFIVKIFPDVISKITFLSVTNHKGHDEITSDKNKAIEYFDEVCERYLNESAISLEDSRKEKLFEYYYAKVDQMKIFIEENFRDILSNANKASSDLTCIKTTLSKVFNQENIERKLKETKGGAFIGSCRSPLYHPEKTNEKLNHFIDFVKEIRDSRRSSSDSLS